MLKRKMNDSQVYRAVCGRAGEWRRPADSGFRLPQGLESTQECHQWHHKVCFYIMMQQVWSSYHILYTHIVTMNNNLITAAYWRCLQPERHGSGLNKSSATSCAWPLGLEIELNLCFYLFNLHIVKSYQSSIDNQMESKVIKMLIQHYLS